MKNEVPLPEKLSGDERAMRIAAGFALVGIIAAGCVMAVALSSHTPEWISILLVAIFLIAIPLNWEECIDGLARAFTRIKQRRQ